MATSEEALTLCCPPFPNEYGTLGSLQGSAGVPNVCYVGEESQWGDWGLRVTSQSVQL